jgi:hypothetical protein
MLRLILFLIRILEVHVKWVEERGITKRPVTAPDDEVVGGQSQPARDKGDDRHVIPTPFFWMIASWFLKL